MLAQYVRLPIGAKGRISLSSLPCGENVFLQGMILLGKKIQSSSLCNSCHIYAKYLLLHSLFIIRNSFFSSSVVFISNSLKKSALARLNPTFLYVKEIWNPRIYIFFLPVESFWQGGWALYHAAFPLKLAGRPANNRHLATFPPTKASGV